MVAVIGLNCWNALWMRFQIVVEVNALLKDCCVVRMLEVEPLVDHFKAPTWCFLFIGKHSPVAGSILRTQLIPPSQALPAHHSQVGYAIYQRSAAIDSLLINLRRFDRIER